MFNELTLSALNKIWLLDLDGTIVKHNGYLMDGKDTLLPNVRSFFCSIGQGDIVIILTARSDNYKELTESFLLENNIKFNQIIYNMPVGERILINDCKLSGLKTAYALNLNRDEGIGFSFVIDKNL